MIELDGAQGEGGGQILRSALALSMITGRPFRIRRIRANRSKPGLLRQHLMSVRAATEISSARVTGDAMGSTELTFEPGPVQSGDYTFSVGSAGSSMLVLQTVLPPLLVAEGPSKLNLEGGTHNPNAPPFDFIERSYLPLVERMGPKVTAVLDRFGFYPVGGGRCSIWIEPVEQLRPLDLHERGEVRQCHATALVASLPRSIGDRELAVVENRLGWPTESLHFRHLSSTFGPGNILLLEIVCEQVTAMIAGFGERGVAAEVVAQRAAETTAEYLESEVPVCPHLADQLMLLLALAGGGAYTTLAPTNHSLTNAEVINRFLDRAVRLQEVRTGVWTVEVPTP